MPASNRRAIDLTDQTFGQLVVSRRAPNTNDNKAAWLCRCACGNWTTVRAANLKNGSTTSCGCVRNLALGARTRTHGLSGSPTYSSWHAMMERCYRVEHPHFGNYGGRGIGVELAWHSFETFYSDMGIRPEGTTLERLDGDKGYGPGNCRWATRREQARNRRGANPLDLPSLAREHGIPYDTLKARPNRLGWSLEDALSKPVRKMKCL